MVKNPPANAEDVRYTGSMSQEDPLEEGMATHFSILASRISWTEEPVGSRVRLGHEGGALMMGSITFRKKKKSLFPHTHVRAPRKSHVRT